jgi:hypothetical protein
MIWRAAVDLLVLATAIYLVLLWGREARALRAFVAILGMRAGALSPGTWTSRSPSGPRHRSLVRLVLAGRLRVRRRAFASLDFVVRLRARRRRRPGVLRASPTRASRSRVQARRPRRDRRRTRGATASGGVPLGDEVSREFSSDLRKVSPVDSAAVVGGGRIAGGGHSSLTGARTSRWYGASPGRDRARRALGRSRSRSSETAGPSPSSVISTRRRWTGPSAS